LLRRARALFKRGSRLPGDSKPEASGVDPRRETGRVEAAPGETKRQLEAIIESAPLAIIALDREGIVKSWNPAAERIYGWTETEVLGQPLPTVPPEMRAQMERNHEEAVHGRVFANYETRRVRKDGTPIEVSISTAPLLDDEGEIKGIVALVEDITERKRAKDNLLQVAAIVESSDDAIISKNLDGTILSWNPGAERLYGYTAAEAVGQPVTMLIPHDRPDEEPMIIEQIKRGERVDHYETVRVRKDGTLINVSLTVSPMKDAQGRITGASKIARDITERRRDEDEKLRLAAQIEGERRRLKELVANVPGVVWEAWGMPDEASQRIDFVSDYVEPMLGYTVNEWLETPNFWLTIVHPEDRERAAREARQKFDTRKGGTSQFRWVTKDGRAIEVEAQSVVICDEQGEPVGMRGVTMDLTGRKRAEEALRQSEERYRAFVAQSSEAIWRFEFDVPLPINLPEDEQIEHMYRHGTLAECNDVMARMYGFSHAEELQGMRLEETLPRNDDNLDYLRAAMRSGYRLTNAESQELDRNGRMKYFLNNLVGIIEGGLLRRVWGTQRDVTERRQAEEEQKFLSDATTILASSLDYASTLDAVAHIAARYLCDYCLVDLLEDDGTLNRIVVAHRDPEREAAWREMQQRFPLDPESPYTIPQVMRTGESLLYAEHIDEMLERALSDAEQIKALKGFGIKSSMIVPLTARGRTVGAVSFISAESGRRYAEAELRLAEELARRAALAIDNARLYQRAQEANRVKDEFLATLSHELRTPLTPIIGWVHLLGGGHVLPADIEHGLEVISQNSQALSRLINDLLDMSAILNGKMRIDRAPVPIESVIREAVETVRPQADRRGVEIELAKYAGEESATVSGDHTRLAQVFWNLLTNAVKFSDDGGRVRVSCERDAGVVRVHIADEGVGIEPEFLPHVFDRFRQADMSTTKLYGGLGIGLALVRSFVEAHHGTVKAESAGAGRGSRFTVSLPLAGVEGRRSGVGQDITKDGAMQLAPNATNDQILKAPDTRHLTPDTRPSRRVLVVEDASDTLEMLRLFFATQGFAATMCSSSEEALDVAAREHFDIIVTDIGLPHTDGYELLRRLRRDAPHLAAAPALALTGYAAETDVAAAHAAGFAAHVAKPFEPATLADAVEKLLARDAPDGAASDGQ
jgi:PAS domain S-box-containing protein